jgi:hypothetical protein
MAGEKRAKETLSIVEWMVLFFCISLFFTLFLIAFLENKGWCLDFS